MPEKSQDDSVLLDIAITHARSRVETYTTQRQSLLNFFLVAVAFLFTAYVDALTGHQDVFAGLIAGVGIVSSLAFISMDLRNRDLARSGEAALEKIEARFAEMYNLDEMKMSGAINQPRRWHWVFSMGIMIRLIYAAIGLVFAAGIIYNNIY